MGKARDFLLRILTDVDKTGADKAADSLDDLGDQAKSTASRVDSALDKIASSSRSNLRKLDDDADRAGRSLDELKDEAGSSGREAAASFSGEFSDVTDLVQETAANAFAGFGPLGVAAGTAAAVGIGFLTSALEAAKERVKALGQALTSADLEGASAFERTRAVLDALLDSERLADYRAAVRNTGISWRDFVDAMGGDQAKIAQVRRELDAVLSSDWRNFAQFTDAGKGAQVLERALSEAGTAATNSRSEVDAYTDALGASTAQAEAYAQVLGDVGDGSSVMADAVELAAQRQADATKDATDSADTYRDTVLASIDDVIAAQLDQLAAADAFEANSRKVYDRLGQDAVDWALSQGENADRAMQLLATAPVEKGREVVENYRRLGEATTTTYAEGVTDAVGTARAAAEGVHAAVAAALSPQVEVPIALRGVSQSALWSTRQAIRDGIGTVEVPLMLRNVTPRSVWETRSNP